MKNTEKLKRITLNMCRFLMEFFYDNKFYRAYTNNNFIVDFYQYTSSSYYEKIKNYLKVNGVVVNYP
jgi:hypothetical protein